MDDIKETCGPSVNSGVFLNKITNFSTGYDKMDFQIRLTDLIEDSRGKTLFKIGVLTESMYDPIHEEKLGWRLRQSKTDKILDLLNSSDTAISSVDKPSRSRIILKYRLVIWYSSGSITMQIVNRETRRIMDTLNITKKHSIYVYTFFGLCEQSYGKIFVKSLSVGRTFNRTTMFRRLHLSNDHRMASNYGIPGENDTENSLILFSQDTEIHVCSKLCVIPFNLYINSFSLNEERWLELSFASTTDTEEVLFCLMIHVQVTQLVCLATI